MCAALSNMDRVVRFGPFELNLDTSELRKHGHRLKLQPKPLQVLQVLVSRKGEVVSRAELKGQLWGRDTYVEFESNLNVTVRRLREILSDDAQNPTYIETVPRTGYKFIAALEFCSREPESSKSSLLVKEQMVISPSLVRRRQSFARRAVWAAAIVLTLALGMFVWQGWRGTSKTQLMASSRSLIPLPASGDFLTTGPNPAPITLSPDGSKMVYVSPSTSESPTLWLRHMDTLTDDPLSGTENASFPFWSPDSKSLAFFADGKLKRIDVATRAVSVICDSWEGRGGSWNRDGIIIFAAGARSPILRVEAKGGAPLPVTTLDNLKYTTHRWPEFLPDGIHFLFFAANHQDASNTDAGIYIGSLKHEETRFLLKSDANASYLAGHLLFAVDNRLYQQPFDPRQPVLLSQPSLLATDLEYDKGLWHASFSAIPNLLVYRKSSGPSEGGRRLAWFRRTGKLLQYVGNRGEFRGVAISPNSKMIALEYGDPDANIWLLDQNKMARLTERALDCCPVWSPDSQYLAISTHRGANQFGVTLRRVDQTLPEISVVRSDVDVAVTTWSPDGKSLLLIKRGNKGFDLFRVDLETHSTMPYLNLQSQANYPVFSPDGRWVAFGDTESGSSEIYVTSFPNPTKRYLVSKAGGAWPAWRRDGRELFFLGPNQTLYATAIRPNGSELTIGAPKKLFGADIHIEGLFDRPFDVDQTGSKLLLVLNAPEKRSDVMLLTNWIR